MEKGTTELTYYKVKVLGTGEEKSFFTWLHAIEWCRQVAQTFNDRMMKFDIVKVIEQTTHNYMVPND